MPNGVSASQSSVIAAGGNALTLGQCRVILERLPKGHPARKAALHDVKVVAGYAKAVVRDAMAQLTASSRRATPR